MTKKLISSILLIIFVFSSVAVSAAEETLTLLPADGDILYAAPESFSASIDGAESILFYLDGAFVGESDNGQLTAPEISFGKHKLTSVAIMADGSTVKSDASFEYRKKIVYGEIKEQNFNSYSDGSVPEDFGFSFNSRDLGTLSRVAGVSGKAGDYAIKVEHNADAANTGDGPRFTFDIGSYKKGIAEFEFDIKHNTTNDTIMLSNPFLWNSSKGYYLTGSGNYRNTGVPLTTDWTRLKFIFDNDKQLVSFYVNGAVVVDAQPFGTNENFKNTNFSFRFCQSENKKNKTRAGATFDNIRAINYKEYLGITDIKITSDGNMQLLINEGLSPEGLSTESVTLSTRDGQSLPLYDVSYSEDEKTLTLIPINDFPADSEIVATLSENLMFADEVPLGSPYETRVTTPGKANANVDFKINSDALYTHRQINADDVISAEVSVENTSGEPLDALYILALRSNKRLVAMSSKTLKLSIGQTENFTLELPEIERAGDYEVKLMVIDSFAGNKAISRYVKLN